MINICNFLLDCCPLATTLTDIPESTCPENIGQIQRYWFVRKGNVSFDLSSNLNNQPVAIQGDDPENLSLWSTLFTQPDDSKVVKTPLIGGDSTITAGTVLSVGGGDNSTLNGSTLINGINPADGSARFDSLTAAQIEAIRNLTCEAQGLEVFLISQEGKIWAKKDGDIVTGFDCSNVILGTMTNNGFGTRDSNVMTFQLDYNYDEYKYSITPADFNALTV